MLLIYSSILKELLLTFLLSVLFLNITLMMEKLLRLSRLLGGVGASLLDMSMIIIYIQPQVLILTIPMSILLSVLLTYGRMNTDNELIILKNTGMSFRDISKPVFYMGIAGFILSISMSFYFGPKGSALLREKVSDILIRKASIAIEEGVFNTSFKDIVMLIKEKPSLNTLSGIFILDERKKEEQKIIVAKDGSIITENDFVAISLNDGHIYITKKDTLTEISFSKYHFRLSHPAESKDKKSSELTPFELIKASKKSPEKRVIYLLEFHRRLSMPAICLITILLGPSLSLMAGKSGRLGGLTVGLIVFALYYSLLLFGENLSRSGSLPHFIGAWLAFVVLGTFSVYVFERINKR